ncbi:MAG: glutamate racemase [Caldimonas sp.]
MELRAVDPIGVYDSGVGGLSVLRALRAALPHESFVYVSDSRHAPYGDRPAGFVESRARDVAGFLVGQRIKALVLACNTASVLAAQVLRAAHALPIVAMEPAIKPAVRLSRSRVVLVLATTHTIRSDSIARLCSDHGAHARIVLQACPGLADRVERGHLDHDDTRRLLEQCLRPGLACGADVIVLGCTHYAFLAGEIARIAGRSVTVLEPSDAIARQLVRVLPPSARAPASRTGDVVFHTSGSAQALKAFLSVIGHDATRVFATLGATE